MQRTLKTILINVGLGAIAIFAAIGIAELYFRITWTPPKYSTADRYAEDPVYNHVFSPNFKMSLAPHRDVPAYDFQTNHLGLRFLKPYADQKPPNTKRLVVCGDSFIEGYDYPRTIPARIEAALAPKVKEKGQELEVIHAGVGTYAPTLHYFALKNKLLPLDPDGVVLAIDMTDSFDDYHRYKPLVYFDANGEPAGVGSNMSWIKEATRAGMIKHLQTWKPDYWIALASQHLYVGQVIFDRRYALYQDQYKELGGYKIPDHGFQRYLFDANNAETAKWIAESQTWMKRIIDMLKAKHIPLLIVMYPYQIQVRDPSLRKIFEVYKKFADDNGVLFFDATPAVLEYPNAAELYLTGDTHFNYKGQEVWGTALANHIAENVDALLYSKP